MTNNISTIAVATTCCAQFSRILLIYYCHVLCQNECKTHMLLSYLTHNNISTISVATTCCAQFSRILLMYYCHVLCQNECKTHRLLSYLTHNYDK